MVDGVKEGKATSEHRSWRVYTEKEKMA